MIKSMLGASFGGTTRGGHHGVDPMALSLITPPKGGTGGGNCLPLMVVVESGEPGLPVVSIPVALATDAPVTMQAPSKAVINNFNFITTLPLFNKRIHCKISLQERRHYISALANRSTQGLVVTYTRLLP
jgi:hypothetical protein